MGRIEILDCTLRDGGYINGWDFGEKALRDMYGLLSQTGVGYLEVGFLRNTDYDPNVNIFTNNNEIANMIAPKNKEVCYVGMIDVKNMPDLKELGERCEGSIDAVRVIFKKDRIEDGYETCERLLKMGYITMAQVVATDNYTDLEFIQLLQKFNKLNIRALYIVDTFGQMLNYDFMRFVRLADHNLKADIALGYHAHNNLQQAYGNAVSFTELGLKRDIMIDACVMGMGRGAGNLNLELFARYLNDKIGSNYDLIPMLQVIDKYLHPIYKENFWGYSLPYYLSAINGCHPDYAKYYDKKGTLSVEAFDELLQGMDAEDKLEYSDEKAEKRYISYLGIQYDDSESLAKISEELKGKAILALAPGKTIETCEEKIRKYIDQVHPVIFSLNFSPRKIEVDYIFMTNLKRYELIGKTLNAPCIITSNLKQVRNYKYKIRYYSYRDEAGRYSDAALVMFLNFMIRIGHKEVMLAGVDGFDENERTNYVSDLGKIGHYASRVNYENEILREFVCGLKNDITIKFLTPSLIGQTEADKQE